MFLDKVASVSRLTPDVGNTNQEQYQAVGNLGSIRINMQPASAELTAVSNGVYGQTYNAFVTVSGIQIGDRITISGTGDMFMVKGTNDWYFGSLPHVELVLFQGDQ